MASMSAPASVKLAPSDDFHHHLRDEPVLAFTASMAAGSFKRAIIMPNLTPPVTTTALALAYRDRILAALPQGAEFEPLMTLYMTDQTSAEELETAAASGAVYAVKLYPAGATTNSDRGVTDYKKIEPALAVMQERGIVLCVHSEVTDAEVDIFDREAVYIETVLKPLVAKFPRLKIVMEHVTTAQGAEFVLSSPPNVGATVTAHHLLYNRNALLVGGIKPHYYCLPILKGEEHRKALLAAVTSGSKKFFLGTDSAPHATTAKHSECGCAGVFTAHAPLELYAEAFDSAGALDHLEAFACHNGADFYGLPRHQGTGVTLVRKPTPVPKTYAFGPGELVPLRAGGQVAWARE